MNDLTGASGPRQEALSRDIHIEAYARAARRIQRHGTKLIPQLHHAGRQNLSLMMYGWPLMQRIGAIWPEMLYQSFEKHGEQLQALVAKYGGPAVAAPSVVPCGYVRQRTRALTHWEIRGLIKDFIRAAKRAQLAGLDGVMLHGTHGYLIQQFLSTRTNKRRDEYGGSFDNRLRFVREIIAGIRETCGKDFPVLVRLTVDEFYRSIGEPGSGIELEEGVRLAKALEQCGIDALDISSGTYETLNWWLEPTTFKPGWRKNLAAAVKQAVDIPVIAANLIRSPKQAEAQLAAGVGVGRHVAHAGVKRVAQRLLLVQPFLEIARGAAAGDDRETRLAEQVDGGALQAALGQSTARIFSVAQAVRVFVSWPWAGRGGGRRRVGG